MQSSTKIPESEIAYVARKLRDELMDLFHVDPDDFWVDEYENAKFDAENLLAKELRELANGR